MNKENKVIYLAIPDTKQTIWYKEDVMLSDASIRLAEAFYLADSTNMTKRKRKSLYKSINKLEVYFATLNMEEEYYE